MQYWFADGCFIEGLFVFNFSFVRFNGGLCLSTKAIAIIAKATLHYCCSIKAMEL